MKLVETKIYLKFIVWFIGVALLPLVLLLLTFYLASNDRGVWILSNLPTIAWIGVLCSLALVLLLSLLATRYLSKVITAPVQHSVRELSSVVDLLLKSIQNLSIISQHNNQISQVLNITSQQQQLGVKNGSKALAGMVTALNKISQKTELITNDIIKTDKLAKEGADKSNKALASLAAVKNLLTENQKLSEALGDYTQKVVSIADRVAVVAETARFFSLNMSIEANKTALSEDFGDLVAQLRDLNNISEQAAQSIQSLSSDMRRHIDQSKQSAVFEWQETNKSINTVVQTLNFFDKIIKSVAQITDNIQVINKESSNTYKQSGDINNMIKDLGKQSQLLVKQTEDIAKVIQNQLVVTRSLNTSSLALNKVTDALDNLVGDK